MEKRDGPTQKSRTKQNNGHRWHKMFHFPYLIHCRATAFGRVFARLYTICQNGGG